jgi:DNA end-binding protein Ku
MRASPFTFCTPNAAHAFAIAAFVRSVIDHWKAKTFVRGYEIEKGRYMRVTDAELDELEAESNSSIDLREFIPIEKINPVYFERAYYLGAEEGGSKAYRLLADAMEKSGRVALAEMIFHNREKLVIIRPMKGGLVLQFMYHEDEVRDFSEIARAEGERLTPGERACQRPG